MNNTFDISNYIGARVSKYHPGAYEPLITPRDFELMCASLEEALNNLTHATVFPEEGTTTVSDIYTLGFEQCRDAALTQLREITEKFLLGIEVPENNEEENSNGSTI